MKLFLKIFLWFLAAITLMVSVVVLLNWTVQTEPVVSRWRVSIKNQTNLFAYSAAQIYQSQGETGLMNLLAQIRGSETIGDVDLIGENGRSWIDAGVDAESYRDLVARTLTSDTVEFDNQPDTTLSARQLTFPDGGRYVLVVRWDRPHFTPFFGESPFKYFRYTILFLTGCLLCWALARYLSSPIGRIRDATQELAGGNLRARVDDRVSRRRDELADLARDFDLMAERIESLITSQQRLTQDVSHELRSPLARMNVALEIVKQKATPEMGPMLDRIETESERLNEMIARILTIAKLESGTDDYERRRIDLTELVRDVAADANFEAQPKGKFVEIISSDKCAVMGSETLLRSAIENVLRNAVRYTPEKTAVSVSVDAVNGHAIVKIADHGGGVPETELPNLFRPFYRVGEDRTRKTGGIGLGLAIADRAVKAHKGTISASNLNGGLSIEIKLDTVKP